MACVSPTSMLCVLIHFVILSGLAVLRNDVSVYVLTCTQLASEIKRLNITMVQMSSSAGATTLLTC